MHTNAIAIFRIKTFTTLLSTILLTLSTTAFSADENDHVLKELVNSAAECSATRILMKDLQHTPLYINDNGECKPSDLSNTEVKQMYGNSSCSGPTVPFRETHFNDYCAEVTAPYHDQIGNAAVWASREPAWTLNPPGKLGISILPIDNNFQPYMKRVRYKSVEVRDTHAINKDDPAAGQVVTLRGMGQCHLEMRVYKKDPLSTGGKPLLMLHGGGWALRGAAFVGFESVMSHFTEQGFVVFTPFYRLSGQIDGNYECNHAPWQEIVADAEDALTWVQQHSDEYGAAREKVYVLGGSAGGYLGAWLAINRKENIERALLFYPPTDFKAYIQQVKNSETPLRGEMTIKRFIGVDDLRTVDMNSFAVTANTFPDIVAQSPSSYPPITFIHGVSDTLVPSDQSVRLCNAYNGDIENGPAKNDGGTPSEGSYSKEYRCGNNSNSGKLYLIAEGNHTLDACIKHIPCPAGGEESQQAVRETFVKAIHWLAQ